LRLSNLEQLNVEDESAERVALAVRQPRLVEDGGVEPLPAEEVRRNGPFTSTLSPSRGDAPVPCRTSSAFTPPDPSSS
jgi:hypothetical protein